MYNNAFYRLLKSRVKYWWLTWRTNPMADYGSCIEWDELQLQILNLLFELICASFTKSDRKDMLSRIIQILYCFYEVFVAYTDWLKWHLSYAGGDETTSRKLRLLFSQGFTVTSKSVYYWSWPICGLSESLSSSISRWPSWMPLLWKRGIGGEVSLLPQR